MNILAINGSPKKNGKISRIVKEIIKGASEENNKCEILYLSDIKNINDCKGCMQCQEQGKCIIRDDILIVEEAIKRNEVIIFATPTHWGNVSGIMLRMIERLFGFLIEEKPLGFPVAKAGKGKKAILVTACSTSWPFNWIFNQSRACFGRLKEVCKYSGIKIIKTFTLPGTTKMDKIPQKYLIKAFMLGRKIK
ncbi:flavodoxin family protein [bacterium]|nr:flavodoxin family protein [bacterium]